MRNVSALLALILGLALAALSAEVALDEQGNLLLASGLNGTAAPVILNGFDFQKWGADIADRDATLVALRTQLAEKDAEYLALKGALDALQRIQIGPFNQLYVFGGSTPGTDAGVAMLESVAGFAKIASFSPVSVTMPTFRKRHVAISYDRGVFLLGGSVNELSTRSTLKFDGLQIVPSANMNTARESFAAVVYQDKLHAIGGYNNTSSLSSVERFDDGHWRQFEPLLAPRHLHAAVTYSNRIYVIGGKRPFANIQVELASVEVYEAGSSVWAQGASLPNILYGHSAAVYDAKIFVVGGLTADFTQFSSMYLFDGTSWSENLIGPVWRGDVKLAVFQGLLWAIGTSTLGFPRTLTASFQNGTWANNGPVLAEVRNGFAAAVLTLAGP